MKTAPAIGELVNYQGFTPKREVKGRVLRVDPAPIPEVLIEVTSTKDPLYRRGETIMVSRLYLRSR